MTNSAAPHGVSTKAEGRMNVKLKRVLSTGATIVLLAGGAGVLTACQPATGPAGSNSGAGATTTAPSGGTGTGEGTSTGVGTVAAAAAGGIGGIGGGSTSGGLKLTQQGTSKWTDQHGPIDLATFSAIPGDVLTYTSDFTITAKGTGLTARLAAEGIVVSGNAALKHEVLSPVITYTSNGTALPPNGVGALVTPALDGKTVTVKVTFTFPKSSTDPAAMQQSINLSNFNVTLKQV